MTGALDETQLRSPVGRRHQISRVRRGNFDVVGAVSDQQAPRRDLRNCPHRIDGKQIVVERLRLEQLLGVTDDARHLDGTMYLFGRATPRLEVRG